jgi:tetratricopeptide (TPR) repeat protein
MHSRRSRSRFSKALAAKPNYLDGKTNQAISLLLQQRRATAVAEFQAILQAAPGNLKAPANLSAAFYEMARYAEASDAFAKAVELSQEKAGRSAEAKEAFADSAHPRPPAHS